MKSIKLNKIRLESIEFSDNVRQQWVSLSCVKYSFDNDKFFYINFEDREEGVDFEKINHPVNDGVKGTILSDFNAG